MAAFFRGWRRKTALITLVIAVALAIAWCVSLQSRFWIHLAVSPSSGIFATAGDGCLIVMFIHNGSRFYSVVDWQFRDKPEAIHGYESRGFVWLLKWPSLGYAQEIGTRGRIITVSVSFSLIVIPLTLFSAYLLLGNRQSNRSQAGD